MARLGWLAHPRLERAMPWSCVRVGGVGAMVTNAVECRCGEASRPRVRRVYDPKRNRSHCHQRHTHEGNRSSVGCRRLQPALAGREAGSATAFNQGGTVLLLLVCLLMVATLLFCFCVLGLKQGSIILKEATQRVIMIEGRSLCLMRERTHRHRAPPPPPRTTTAPPGVQNKASYMHPYKYLLLREAPTSSPSSKLKFAAVVCVSVCVRDELCRIEYDQSQKRKYFQTRLPHWINNPPIVTS